MEQSKQEMEAAIEQQVSVIISLGEHAFSARVHALLDMFASVIIIASVYTQRMEWFMMDGCIAVAVYSLYNLKEHVLDAKLSNAARLQMIIDADVMAKAYKARFPPKA